MKTLRMQRRLASLVLGVGKNKIWFNPERIDDIKEALTRLDIEELIKDGAIKEKKKTGKKAKTIKKKKKNRIGTGSIRKKVIRRKRDYIRLVRKLRGYLKMLKLKQVISNREYNYLRKLAKAKQFDSLSHLKMHIKEGLYKEKFEEKEIKIEEKAEKSEEKEDGKEKTKNRKKKIAKEIKK